MFLGTRRTCRKRPGVLSLPGAQEGRLVSRIDVWGGGRTSAVEITSWRCVVLSCFSSEAPYNFASVEGLGVTMDGCHPVTLDAAVLLAKPSWRPGCTVDSAL